MIGVRSNTVSVVLPVQGSAITLEKVEMLLMPVPGMLVWNERCGALQAMLVWNERCGGVQGMLYGI